MRVYPDSKVYILCPGNVHTGGPELCHQLCSQLISLGVNAYMFYIPDDNPLFNPDDPVHPFYKKYHLPYTFFAEDSERNIFVVPEIFSMYFYQMKNFQRVFYWMSVDNYIKNTSGRISKRAENPLSEPMPRIFFFNKEDFDITHFVQSEYAYQFLKLNGVPEYKIYTVEDYLNQAFLNRATEVDLSKKKNFVTYYPLKGFEITQQLMSLAPDIDWRPIRNMTPAQVRELLASAKVYIDFGNHPGKDRIPREAALSGCVVITGKRGAAANEVDINIPAEFKFDEHPNNFQGVVDKIREVFDNFPAAHEKQAAYRARILDDKNRFAREVAAAFGVKNAAGGVAILRAVDVESYSFAGYLCQNKEFKPNFIIDDKAASAKKISGEGLLREHNRNYLHIGENLIEIITREDAKFLYLEERIRKIALFNPTNAEIDELKNLFAPKEEDILIFSR